MHNELLIAILAGLGGMFGWGFADLFAKKTIDEIGDVVSLAWAHIFGTLLLFIFIFYGFFASKHGITIPPNSQTWFLLLFFGMLQALVYLLVYKGFSKGQVAVLNPIFASFAGLVAIFSIFALGEVASGKVLISLAILFFGVILINIDINALRNKYIDFVHVPGFKEVAFATVLAAFWTLAWDKFINGKDWMSYALLMYFFMTVAILIFSKLRNIKLSFSKPSAWKFLILIGGCEITAYLAISYGYSLTPHTSIVALLSGAFSLPTIILAHLFLKEKITFLQKLGGLIIISGIILLSLLK